MSGEAQPKQLKDFSEEVKQKIPEYTAHITDKSTEALVNEAIAQLLNLEKKTRLAADARSTSEVSLAILRVCVTTKSWRTLNDHITLLSKRRAQLQKVQENIITYGATIVQQQSDATIKRQLIETLRTVSDGKMFAELDRARLTKTLAVMEENDGKINEAAELLQEVQVETIGSMETREKAEFLCEQVRLCLAKRDYVRAEIIAKKVDEKLLNEEQYQDLKVRYYKLKIQYHTHYGNYLEIFKAYRHIYNTTSVQADPTQWQPALRRVIIYLILSPFDAEVSDAVQRTLLLDKKVAQLPAFKSVLDAFTTDEVMAWPLPSEAEWKADETFAGASADVEMKDANDKAEPAGATAKDRWADLHKRVVQHNIRVIAKYYARITSQRLGNLLGLDVAKSETFLSEMVSSKQLFAKIDRPTGIITFAATLSPSALVNAWSDDIVALLNLVEKTCHSINKENMVYQVGTTSSA